MDAIVDVGIDASTTRPDPAQNDPHRNYLPLWLGQAGFGGNPKAISPCGEQVSIADLTDQFVTLNKAETAEPDAQNVAGYQELQALQDAASKALRGVFQQHRKFVLR